MRSRSSSRRDGGFCRPTERRTARVGMDGLFGWRPERETLGLERFCQPAENTRKCEASSGHSTVGEISEYVSKLHRRSAIGCDVSLRSGSAYGLRQTGSARCLPAILGYDCTNEFQIACVGPDEAAEPLRRMLASRSTLLTVKMIWSSIILPSMD